MVNGQLVPSSLDCYLSMELGEDGDLFNLRCCAFRTSCPSGTTDHLTQLNPCQKAGIAQS